MTYDVTIGIPVYNVVDRIRQTLDAALAQTFQAIEFLIVDDCGTDGSIDVVRDYQRTHPRGADIHVVRQPENMGIGMARNRIIDEAQGRYLFFLDADDLIAPNAIELLYANAQQHQAEIVYGSHERIYAHADQPPTVKTWVYPHRVFLQPNEYAEYVYNVGIQVMHWNALVDIDIYRRNHLRVASVGHGYGEDYTFTVDLPTYVTRAVLLPDITYSYYIDESAPRHHKVLNRRYLDNAIAAIDQKKRRSELKGKPYYARRLAMLLMYDYSYACQIVRRRNEPQPRYTNREIRTLMYQPMSLGEILTAPQARASNLKAYLLWHLPPSLCVWAIGLSEKLRNRHA